MAAETNGRLQIQGFANGQLGNAQETPKPALRLARFKHFKLVATTNTQRWEFGNFGRTLEMPFTGR